MLALDSFELVEVLVKVLAGTYGHVDQRKQSTVWEIVKRNCIERRCKTSETQGFSYKRMLKSVSGAVVGKLCLVKSENEKFHQGIKSSFPCSTLLLEGKTPGKTNCCYRENRLGPSGPHLWLQAWPSNNPNAVQGVFHAELNSSTGVEA